MKHSNYFSIKFENDSVTFLDQTKLPLEENYVQTDDYERIAIAIERLEVRGAPLIGISAAYALAVAMKEDSKNKKQTFNKAYQRLKMTRPTAVNLFAALSVMKEEFSKINDYDDAYNLLLNKAKEIHKKDEEYCSKIGRHGINIFKKKSTVLTHCNTGKLGTGGDGTAFSVIKHAFENDLVNFVYADETRPLLQGSRLTAYELEKSGIPFSLQTDSSAAFLMQQGKIDLVITGADRIALNGDTANKIGTYSLAVSSYHHNIPLYIAAPSTTIDRAIASGKEIEIEYRNSSELLSVHNIQIASSEYDVFTPAFDITPAHLIKGIITEEDIFNFPYNFLR
ncbi:MAG: S-methyl-5-thioribose-1-phosphate isomerase [Ignavibacterium sp.]|nr:MAG: S-methyl-5-thioribose-1-phosphate isomerase [Ignavibacterium sp.]